MKKRIIGALSIAMILIFASGCNTWWVAPTPPVTYFPTQKNPRPDTMAALLVGRLVIASGCLRVDHGASSTFVPVWPYGFSMRIQNDMIEVLDEKGMLRARVGDTLRLGGGVATDSSIAQFVAQLPPASCGGPYWIVGHEISR